MVLVCDTLISLMANVQLGVKLLKVLIFVSFKLMNLLMISTAELVAVNSIAVQ